MAKLFAAFPEETTAKEIDDFWIAEMEEDLLTTSAPQYLGTYGQSFAILCA